MNVSSLKTTPIAVIGFSDRASPLKPVWPTTHRAIVPIAGKPLVVHLIELLAEAGIRHLRIAGSIQQYPVKNRLRDGCEWGMKIRYSDLHGDDLRSECLATTGQCLYLLGDELHHANLGSLLTGELREISKPAADRSLAGLWRMSNGQMERFSLGAQPGTSAYVNKLRDASDYHDANLQAASGNLEYLNIPGGAIHDAAFSDWKTEIAPTAYIGDNVFLGKHCRIGNLVRLEQDCVVSTGAVIGSGARLQNVTVLPNCYVGSKMCLRDAILGPQGILSLDGGYWPICDQRLLGNTRDSREQITGIPNPDFLKRFAISGNS